MDSPIIETPSQADDWLQDLGQPVARRLLDWEQQQADRLLADVFGYHALQVGWPALQALRHNRMPHRWQVLTEFETQGPGQPADLCMDSRAWPWPADSLDLVVLPHTLERSDDAHACLREVERVLIPEGHLLITGLNPWSWWGWRQMRAGRAAGADRRELLIGYHRLRDWLRLLGFEVQVSRFSGWTPALRSERWMQRWSWLDALGQRWWPIFGGVYLILAVKRVPGGRWLDGRQWQAVRSPHTAAVPLARSDNATGRIAPHKDCS